MRYVLPPMHTLRTFEALSRLRSFTVTAEELHLTTSAVSHQIRAIESFYATKLFRRNRHDVSLTPAGEKLLEVVQGFLQQLSSLGESLRTQDPHRLSVTAPPSLVSRWLMPRLGDFLRAYPEVDFKLHATLTLIDLDAEQADVAVRYGDGRWPGLHSEKLFDEQIFPVASPTYVARAKLHKSSKLKGCTLLRDDFQSWERWGEATGENLDASAWGPVYSDSALLLQATEAGHGVALGRSVLIADAIAAGALIRIGKRAISAPGSYYLVSPTRKGEAAQATAFRRWLTEQAGR
ncbi:LysR family transcriptional regulator, glycine cleavage system transcriptional activator [Dyella sp. OK004]|uniref:LysR substrate-binding domain-containing protein n=1 Tax=Dyella sp. OK004 TaxID=1855292 RepID=UPI0008EE9BCB|nr:LysR substrate-binding domain-containing protein [Dyella sp. OK004]SFS03713.1 LysR family transcriptional regulator, glycine cleavage system transcriptional activator [Dyella sp. OK004]